MIDISKISEIISTSPSVELLRLKNREAIIIFFARTFPNQQGAVSSEFIHGRLVDHLENNEIENEEESQVEGFDTYESQARRTIKKWTDKGFLTNYKNEKDDEFYELSSHSSKTIDWLSSLKKEEYVGTESKFKSIFNLLKELVEFTNDDAEKRIQLLEDKKLEIEQQIKRLKIGEDVKVFEEFEIVPRFNQLNQSAKELLTDFKEVEGNFIKITKGIYQKHADKSLKKSDILDFTFEALDELKDSQQGKSFYAFWSFLLNPSLQNEWDFLTKELYSTLENKEILVQDSFLKGMKNLLWSAGQKVYKSNDRMADKLSRIIRENETTKSEATKNIIQELKKTLIEISQTKKRPMISLELESEIRIKIPFDRKLTFEQLEEQAYTSVPQLASTDIADSKHVNKLYAQVSIDKGILRSRIQDVLRDKSQTTVHEVIENFGGLKKGLPELFGYINIAKEFKHSISPEKRHLVLFDLDQEKSILIPEIIISL